MDSKLDVENGEIEPEINSDDGKMHLRVQENPTA